MSQNAFNVPNGTGSAVRADLISALQALATVSSGATAPATTYAGMLWWDTTANLIKQRNGANTAWITVASFDGSTVIPYRAGTALGTAAIVDSGAAAGDIGLNDQAFADVASATTTDIGAAASMNVRITGTVTITGLGTVAAGIRRKVRFAAALTLTHNATSLILPGGANITTAADDTAEFISLGSGNWLCLSYKPADGQAPRPRIRFYSFVHTSDTSITTKVPTGTLWSSSQSILVPSKGIILCFPTIRVDNSNAGAWNYYVGMRIGGTDFFPSSNVTTTTDYMQIINSIASGNYEFTKGKVSGASYAQTAFNLDVEAHAISTGSQTAQPVIASENPTPSSETLKGATYTCRMQVIVMDTS